MVFMRTGKTDLDESWMRGNGDVEETLSVAQKPEEKPKTCKLCKPFQRVQWYRQFELPASHHAHKWVGRSLAQQLYLSTRTFLKP